jgi:hypothetical protein
MTCVVCQGPIRSVNKYGVCTRTPECVAEGYRRRGRASYVNCRVRNIMNAAKRRAAASGAPFAITPDDVPPIPETCPILGITLCLDTNGAPRPNSPSLDRKNPVLGYVPGNIWWVSHQANTMKSSADVATLRKFAAWVMTLED